EDEDEDNSEEDEEKDDTSDESEIEGGEEDFHLDAEKQFGAPAVFSHRADLHEALRAKATSEDGPGIPIELVTKAIVVSFEAHTRSVTLEDGSTLTADLVVAADGI
ncbi:hypothetical protein V500_04798, partial [Pseudogymnoascus sp. VKM F-4518 (FW-2643)]